MIAILNSLHLLYQNYAYAIYKCQFINDSYFEFFIFIVSKLCIYPLQHTIFHVHNLHPASFQFYFLKIFLKKRCKMWLLSHVHYLKVCNIWWSVFKSDHNFICLFTFGAAFFLLLIIISFYDFLRLFKYFISCTTLIDLCMIYFVVHMCSVGS